MSRCVGVSELRRRPMEIIRQAQDSHEGATITYRGIPVAVLRGWIGPRLSEADLDRGAESEDAGSDRITLNGSPDLGGGWLAGGTGPQAPDDDAALDSASWGLWENLPDAQRRALMRAIQARRSGTDGEVACQGCRGEERLDGDGRTA